MLGQVVQGVGAFLGWSDRGRGEQRAQEHPWRAMASGVLHPGRRQEPDAHLPVAGKRVMQLCPGKEGAWPHTLSGLPLRHAHEVRHGRGKARYPAAHEGRTPGCLHNGGIPAAGRAYRRGTPGSNGQGQPHHHPDRGDGIVALYRGGAGIHPRRPLPLEGRRQEGHHAGHRERLCHRT